MSAAVTQSSAEAAPRARFMAAADERVVYRELREPPILLSAVALAVVLCVATISSHRVPTVVAAALISAAAVAVAIKLRPRTWIEEFVISDRRLVVVQRKGGAVSVPLEDVSGVTIKGGRATFDTAQGDIPFAYVRNERKLQRAIERELPGFPIELEWDPLCRS